MHFSIEKMFVVSLWMGFLTSVGLYLSAGRIRFIRFHRWFRLPKIFRANSVPVAPMLIGMFLTVFGSFGLMFRILLGWSALISVVAALISAAMGSGLCVRFLSWFFSDTATEITGSPLLGTMARVSLAIPESGTGSIACVVGGKRAAFPARSISKDAIEKDTSVLIVDFVGRIALVEVF